MQSLRPPEVPPAVPQLIYPDPVKSNPVRFPPVVEGQTDAGARADAAVSIPASCGLHCRTQSNPNPADAARSKSFSASGQIPFRVIEALTEATLAIRPRAESTRQPHSQTSVNPADNPPARSATGKIGELACRKDLAAATWHSKQFDASRQGLNQAPQKPVVSFELLVLSSNNCHSTDNSKFKIKN